MSNTVDKLNQAIADFVTQPGNRVLRPGTGRYSTPFRGTLFGYERASDVEAALEDRRASALLLTPNPNAPESLEQMRSDGESEGDWPDFQRQMESGYFGEAKPTDDGTVRAWDPIHDPDSAGRGQHHWTLLGDAIEEGIGSLDGVAHANVLPWGSGGLDKLIKFLRSAEEDLLDRVIAFANQQLRIMLRALRPRVVVVASKKLTDESWASELDIARDQATELRDVSPVNLTGRRYKISVGKFASAGSTHPLLHVRHPRFFQFVRSEDHPKVTDAIAKALGEATAQEY